MLPRPLLLAVCFIMAMFAGWAARSARPQPADASHAAASSAAASAALTLPAGLDDTATRTWLAEHLTDATAEQLKDIATRLLTVPELSERAWNGVFSCWFEKDPAAAWAFASTKPDQRLIALQEWAALDPAAARAALTTPSADDWLALVTGAARKDMAATFRLTDEALAAGADLTGISLDRNNVVYAGLLDFATLDPDATAAWAEKVGIAPVDIQDVLLMGRWKKDPAAAKQWLAQQTDRAKVLSSLASFARAIKFYQPSLMDFIAESLPPGNARMEVIQDLLKGLAWRDPEFAGKEAARVIPDAGMRSEVIAKIASLLSDSDFAKAWSLLDSLGSSTTGNQRLQIPQIEIYPGSDAGSVSGPMRYRMGLVYPPDASSPADEKGYLLRSMMETDKEEAIRLMEGIAPDRLVNEAGSAFELWAERDRDEAVRWLAGRLGDLGAFRFDSAAGRQVMTLVENISADERTALLADLPPGTVRTMLTAMHTRDLAEDDPIAALDYARASGTAEEPVIAAYGTWASTDGMAALKHLTGDSKAPAWAWEIVADAAFEESPEEATRIIEAIPDPASHDAAITSVLEFLEDSDPLESAPWALALNDTLKRKDAIEAVLRQVSMDLRASSDAATADALRKQVEAAETLPAEERKHWLERINLECTAR